MTISDGLRSSNKPRSGRVCATIKVFGRWSFSVYHPYSQNSIMFAAGYVVFLATVVSSGSVVSTGLMQQRTLNDPKMPGTNVTTGTRQPDSLRSNVSECILLFGAFCNGNLGDVIQASTMSRLLKSVASDSLCVWHAYPSKEKTTNGFHEGALTYVWGSAVEICIISNFVYIYIYYIFLC